MHRGLLRTVLLLFWTLTIIIQTSGVSFAQEGTPLPETGLEDTPKFALLPLGDHPDGYFKDVVINPGETVELAVVVDNGSSFPLDLRTYKVNALSGINGGYVSGNPTDPPLEATTWINYPTIELQVGPGEQQNISFEVSVPSDAQPGQYISGLVVETAEPVPIPGTDVLDHVISYAISVGVLVPGELIHSFDVGQPIVTDRYLDIPVTNTGNFLVRPSGELSLIDGEGKVVLNSPVQMGSIYAGLSTHIRVILPDQMKPGEYTVSLSLSDEESGASQQIDEVAVSIEEREDPTAVTVASANVAPNAIPIVFADVDISLHNGGQGIPATNVTLNVMHDGELVEEFPLATNQVLLNGENQFVTRYLPATMWESGTYTFGIVVSAVDPTGGQETILLDEELDAEIVVP